MKILIAGEGISELGRWAYVKPYQSKQVDCDGMIESFLRRIRRDGWSIADGIAWSKIPAYKARGSQSSKRMKLGPEAHKVLALLLRADETQCDAVVFLRDLDKLVDRKEDIDDGIDKARELFSPQIAGGVPVRELESWLLSLLGDKNAEQRTDA